MKRSRAERRHERQRAIDRRLRLIREAFGGNPYYDNKQGVLSKHNLVCSCPMCRGPRYDRSEEREWARREIDDAL